MSRISELDELNAQVSAALYELMRAQLTVSRIEEKIARLTSPSSLEGRIARRGAVRAAVAGGDNDGAKELVKRFLAEDGIDKKLSRELKALLRQ